MVHFQLPINYVRIQEMSMYSFYNCAIQMSQQIFVFIAIFSLIECHFVFENILLKVQILYFNGV